MIFIIKGFWIIAFIFIVISTTFWSIFPPTFFRFLSNSGTFTELRTTSFIESTGVTCSHSVSHNRVQVLSIPVLLLACSQDWTCNLQIIVSLEAKRTNAYNRYAMLLHSYIHEYGYVRNGHRMLVTYIYREHRNLEIRKHVTTSLFRYETFLLFWG